MYSEKNMEQIRILVIVFLRHLIIVFGDECISSFDGSVSVTCADSNSIDQLSNFTNVTQLSLIDIHLMEMPDLADHHQLTILHLNNNQIQLVTRNYSSVEYLYLTSNHIYALHLSNLSYPKLKLLDLSHNPIEHIVENFFSAQQFPQLQILNLTNTLKHINPYLIDNRLISFSSLTYLSEIYFDENEFDEFSCSKNITYIQWSLPSNLNKLSFAKNRLDSFDEFCLMQIRNLTQLNLQYNLLKDFPNLNFTLPYLSKLQLEYNSFRTIPSNLFIQTKQLIELNLSANQLNFTEMKAKKQALLPNTLKILYLNSITTDLPCALFENLTELERLHLADLSSTQLDDCMFKKLSKLKTLELRHHHLKIIDEQIFRPLLTMNQLEKLDLSSQSLLCDACSLRWLIDFVRTRNQTTIICLDRYGEEIRMNTLDLSPCVSAHNFAILVISISISISILLSLMLCIYTYQNHKFPFSKLTSVYHMIPLQNYDRIYQNTTDDITNDNVMLVT